MKTLLKSVNFGISLMLIVGAIGVVSVAIPAFGNKALIVRSASMQPTLQVGSLVVVKSQSPMLSPLAETIIPQYQTGEIIAFRNEKNPQIITTHRIVGSEIKDGKVFYQTKGDANETPDSGLVAENNVVGKTWLTVPLVGKVFGFTKTNIGFPLLVIFPAFLVIVFESFAIFKEIRKQKIPQEQSLPNFGAASLTILVLIAATILVFQNSFAFFSDSETSTSNVFQAAESFCSELGEVWAVSVASSSQGTRKDGTSVLPERSNPDDVLGIPDGVGSPASGFFSLGFGGQIVIEFADFVQNGTGDDLSFHEITNGRNTYPLEKVKVEVSADSSTWFEIGQATSEPGGDGVTLLDIASNAQAPSSVKFVRITDTTDSAIHSNDADGFDLDAVDAKYGCLD